MGVVNQAVFHPPVGCLWCWKMTAVLREL